MSQAFVKEGDALWLHDIPPTIPALINFLSRENNGIRVNEVRNYYSEKLGYEIWEMTNGLYYTKTIDAQNSSREIWKEVIEII